MHRMHELFELNRLIYTAKHLNLEKEGIVCFRILCSHEG